jgi:hypothetical protein
VASNRWSDGKQSGNPNGRPEYKNTNKPPQTGADVSDWTTPDESAEPPVISGTGFLIKQTNTLRADLERSRQRAVSAIDRLKKTAAEKVKFLERLADMAEEDLEETKNWHDEAGV